MTAREITGDEKAEWWERAVAVYPPHAEYQEKTEDLIRVAHDLLRNKVRQSCRTLTQDRG
jgi:hypothetical protein